MSKTNGEVFKQRMGFSKTMKRNLAKHSERGELGVINWISIDEYKSIRKKRKKEEHKLRKDKHHAAMAGRNNKSSKKIKV